MPVQRKRSVSWSCELATDRHSLSSTLIVISNRRRAEGKTGAGSYPHGSVAWVLLTLCGLRLLRVGGVGFLQVITGPVVHRQVQGVHTHLSTILFSESGDTHQRFQNEPKTTFDWGVLLQITSVNRVTGTCL